MKYIITERPANLATNNATDNATRNATRVATRCAIDEELKNIS
jgi:multidrug resistance efflux pump